MKTCGTCGQTKPLEAFHKAAASPQGRNKHCADCVNAKYRQWRVEGRVKHRSQRPHIPSGRARPLAERLWAKVDKNGPIVRPELGPCWLWTGVHNGTGYGQIFTGTERPGEQRMILVHRAALIVSGVKLPRAMKVDHICKVILCCNPDHLRIVTPTVSSLENTENWCAKNKRKTHCIRGHELISFGSYALLACRISTNGHESVSRYCLRCYPSTWNHPNRIFLTA